MTRIERQRCTTCRGMGAVGNPAIAISTCPVCSGAGALQSAAPATGVLRAIEIAAGSSGNQMAQLVDWLAAEAINPEVAVPVRRVIGETLLLARALHTSLAEVRARAGMARAGAEKAAG